MKKLLLATVSAIAMGTSATPAQAGEVDELKAMMQKMSQQMQAMQSRINELEHKEHKAASSAPSSDSDVTVSFNPTPKMKSKDGAFSAKVIGFSQADAVLHNEDTTDQPDSTTIKRARLGIAGHFLHDWGYKFLYDFGNNNNDQLQDMFLTYKGFNDTKLIAGQYKEPFGLEWQSPAKYWTFMELPLSTALTPRRAIGAGFTTQHDAIRLSLGAFGENANKTRSDDEGYAFDGHLVYTPLHTKGRHLHLGASASYRVPDAASKAVSYGGKIESSSSSTNSVATGSISNVDHTLLGGIEMLGIWGPYLLQGEYVMNNVSRESGFSDEQFSSYYLQGAWMLTGESRKFNPKKHMFTRVMPNNPLNDGGIGAWELAARFENLDLNDDVIQAGEMDRYILGLNWHPNQYTRFMLNYSFVDTDNNANLADDNSQSVALRAQIDF